ncbi:hypothetical protein HQN88_12620 [Paenibacillus qinlingensis]|nr:hypothetical protein [Paenibacillus qinlingensis]
MKNRANRRNLPTGNTVNLSNSKNLLQIDGENPVRLLEGDTILTDFSALAGYLIHPSDYGHILMG